jgi:hypothetical protein
MNKLTLPFKVQDKPLENSAFESNELSTEQENLPDENFEEFVKKAMLGEQPNDVPDTIWTLRQKANIQKRIK